MTTTVGKIDTWFPKSIYIKELLLEQTELHQLELIIRKIYADTVEYNRTVFQQVNSTHKICDDIHNREDMVFFLRKLLPCVVSFATSLGYSEKQKSRMCVDNMWFNISNENDYVSIHNHSGCIISGAFYLTAPTGSKIRFLDSPNMIMPPENFTELSYEYAEYECESNRLLLFKSDFLHGTDRQPAGEKIVISFNISMR
jgi:uncharacterized protein (TIGR02466 family)